MRFYTKHHQFHCDIDLHAHEGIPFVLGHALYMEAIHGGKANKDTIDAQKIAILGHGGMLPQAYVYPAGRQGTRDLLRPRMHLMRKRAEQLGHIQHANSQYNLPEIGQKTAYQANRAGVAERFLDPAVQKSIEVDLALIDHDDQLRRDVELSILNTAKPHHANTRSLLRTVPGIGEILSLVWLYEIHDIQRFLRAQDFVSCGRLVTCAKESAGKRYGMSGTTSGNAYLTWAFSEAAVLFLRTSPAGQKYLARLAKQQGQGIDGARSYAGPCGLPDVEMRNGVRYADVAPELARSGAGEPDVSLDEHGMSLTMVLCHDGCPASRTHKSTEAVHPAPAPLIGHPLRLCYMRCESWTVHVCCPSPDPGTHWRTGSVLSPL